MGSSIFTLEREKREKKESLDDFHTIQSSIGLGRSYFKISASRQERRKDEEGKRKRNSLPSKVVRIFENSESGSELILQTGQQTEC